MSASAPRLALRHIPRDQSPRRGQGSRDASPRGGRSRDPSPRGPPRGGRPAERLAAIHDSAFYIGPIKSDLSPGSRQAAADQVVPALRPLSREIDFTREEKILQVS